MEEAQEKIFKLLYPYAKPKPNELVDQILATIKELGYRKGDENERVLCGDG